MDWRDGSLVTPDILKHEAITADPQREELIPVAGRCFFSHQKDRETQGTVPCDDKGREER